MNDVLHIAEIPYDTGEVRFRFCRYLAEDGSEWIRHGLFRAFYRNGQLKSEGQYEHDAEQGLWRDYHENGQLAAEGLYENAEEAPGWKYWNSDGVPELANP